jgi:leucyl-tRNA synthetase
MAIMKNYDSSLIEKHYKSLWDDGKYINNKKSYQGKYYCLDMFPYPSANGVHVGHWRGYVLSDIYARKKWLEGYEVLHPMGWDAFGLPAENYAIKNQIHPEIIVKESISNFKVQLKKIGALYNWDHEINTTDPEYYKWTQWIFLQMYHAGLAYQAHTSMNWCPSCKTGLANEEVSQGQCERCHTQVEKKKIRQWMLKITQYAEELLEGLDRLEWPSKVKLMQKNWIGKSTGLEITFKIDQIDESVLIYTTKPETIYGVAFIGLSYNHPLVEKMRQKHNIELEQYIATCEKQPPLDKDKISTSGFCLDIYAIHPITNKHIPIYIAQYVLSDYGTGAVMGVPAHDERDYEFAKHNKIFFKPVIMDAMGDNSEYYGGEGVLFNCNQFNGMHSSTDGRKNISNFLIQQKLAVKKINYKMRDWIFSRQRYWGEPIPLIHCPACGVVPVPESELPVVLPYVEHYQPTGDGTSPLEGIHEWVTISCYQCGGKARRETNTMPQWAGSCWYFLRYPDPHNKNAFCSKQLLDKWLPVDLYVGGVEHAILHLLYSRFYVKFLYEKQYINFDEPFTHLFNQGMVNYKSEKSGLVEKMSKSKGNVVCPDDIINKYGTDALRLYIIFLAPPEIDCVWQDDAVAGCARFLKRFWHFFSSVEYETENMSQESSKRCHQFLKEFEERITTFHTNTAVASMMEFINDATEKKMQLDKIMKIKILSNCSIMIPFICAELLSQCGVAIQDATWAKYDPQACIETTTTIIVQVNGRVRDTIIVARGTTRHTIEKIAQEKIERWLLSCPNKEFKTIYVQDKLINFIF